MSKELNSAFQASIEIDTEAAQERLKKILHPQPGPTLTPQPQTQPQAPAETMRRGISKEDMKKYVEEGIPVPAPRKKRSDAGIPKKAPADPDEIVLRMPFLDAQQIALRLRTSSPAHSIFIQDQIIAQLQKRLDALQKAK